ncbi:MAG TPA: hypothetical protein VJB62_01995 [Patescibacteria group bacterium]|nr:hypothetical protein [Patescibacteria group bacterium]
MREKGGAKAITKIPCITKRVSMGINGESMDSWIPTEATAAVIHHSHCGSHARTDTVADTAPDGIITWRGSVIVAAADTGHNAAVRNKTTGRKNHGFFYPWF